MNSLLAKKLLWAFLFGFVPVFLGVLINVFETLAQDNDVPNYQDIEITTGLLWAGFSGAVAAGIRLAMVAWNAFPTDKLHGPNKTANRVEVDDTGRSVAVPAPAARRTGVV